MKIGRLNRASFAKTARRAMFLFAFAVLGTQAATVAMVNGTGYETLEAAIAADPQTANAQLVVTTSAIDKAASKGVMHKNAANRKKARLAKQLAKATV